MKRLNKTPTPVMAAGGIIVRQASRPLVGIVRLRKDDSWVLPKGKLKPGESALAAAKREVEEETGHGVTVLGFLGSMSQATEGRHKIVQFWHMRASRTPVRPLMRDVKAVKWLPLRQAVETLSRPHEKLFLSHVGPAALKAADPPPRVVKPVEPAPPSMPPELPAPLEQQAIPPEQETMPRVTVCSAIMSWLRRVAPRQFDAE